MAAGQRLRDVIALRPQLGASTRRGLRPGCLPRRPDSRTGAARLNLVAAQHPIRAQTRCRYSRFASLSATPPAPPAPPSRPACGR